VLCIVIAVPFVTGEGSELNLAHCKEKHVENVDVKFVAKLMLGNVTFFKT
jgi:hypothetical protein